MQFRCNIDKLVTLKKGMKLILQIEDEEKLNILKNIHNFMDKPITVDVLIDTQKAIEQMNTISEEQRKKAYALFKDIGEFIGDDPESIKVQMKNEFLQQTEYGDFSLSNCSFDLAGDFIEWMIQFCFTQGIRISDHPREGYRDIEKYIAMCIEKKKCCVCGQDGSHYTWEGTKKIPLCKKHHLEATAKGRTWVTEQYHVYGI